MTRVDPPDFPVPGETPPPDEPAAGDWRGDPAWTLVSYDAAWYAQGTPPATPPADAELAQPDLWASLYGPQGRILATWYRGPVRSR